MGTIELNKFLLKVYKLNNLNSRKNTPRKRSAIGIRNTGVVIHSSNSTNSNSRFANTIKSSLKNTISAQYFIDRKGQIVESLPPDYFISHTGVEAKNRPKYWKGSLTNENSVGIELFNNVGEPFDGRQIVSLIKLIEYLSLKYDIPRPVKDPQNGLAKDYIVKTSKILTHMENISYKCDPFGFDTLSNRQFLVASLDPIKKRCDKITQKDNKIGSDSLPVTNGIGYMHIVRNTLATMHREKNGVGVINVSGGDALNDGTPGSAGNIIIAEEPTKAIPALTLYSEHNRLVIGKDKTKTISGKKKYTDVIIEGVLELSGNTELNISGTFYISPKGKVISKVVRNDAVNLTVYLNGLFLNEGLIDLTGKDSLALIYPNGGNGGNFTLNLTWNNLLIVPTLIAVGGDGDETSESKKGIGGKGGDVSIKVPSSPVFFSGGTSGNGYPPLYKNTININDFQQQFPEHIGNTLPAGPLYYYYSIGNKPVDGEKIKLRKVSGQAGFYRGIVTSGGTGASEIDKINFISGQAGAKGGSGGNINIKTNNIIVFKDMDIITGSDIETVYRSVFAKKWTLPKKTYFAPTGSLGGAGANTKQPLGGDGGDGGDAGEITVLGTLSPKPKLFHKYIHKIGEKYDPIIGLDGEQPKVDNSDQPLYDYFRGNVYEARNKDNLPLYRIRLDKNQNLLGGSGGISGSGFGNWFDLPGRFGKSGKSGKLIGLPIQ